MPIVIALLVLAAVVGLVAPRRVALALTGLGAAAALFVWTWAVADGKGDDPAWTLVIPAAAALVALWIADAVGKARRRRPVA
jgi:hypothetical protein